MSQLRCGLSEEYNCSEATDNANYVYVLNESQDAARYCMQSPDYNYAACSCNTGKQGSMCKHQIAWLLAEFPYGDQAERLIVSMPGTRLGFVEGCSMEDISDLTTELSLLHASEMHCTQTASHEQRDADSLRGTEQGTVLHLAVACENADGNLDKWVPGTQAHNNHRSRIEKIVQQQLEAIRHADPLRQKDLMIQQESSLNSLLLVLEAAGLHPADAQPSENFGVTGDGKCGRKTAFGKHAKLRQMRY
jgi:hypothetical protein